MKTEKDEKKTTNEKPVSLAPLDFKEALEGLLKVKPEENRLHAEISLGVTDL